MAGPAQRCRIGGWMLERRHERGFSREFDPLALMVMSNAVSMIAEEMGVVLERGALSPNIRERRDASSALFDAQRANGRAGRAHSGAPRRHAGVGARGDGPAARSRATSSC